MAAPLYQSLAETLARSIRGGTLVRGERLPSVRTLARQHGVSLATAVPEPGPGLLLLAGLATMAWRLRRAAR